jgi:subtilisin family serine protease
MSRIDPLDSRRPPALTAAALAFFALFALPVVAAPTTSDGTVARATEDRDSALVQLKGEPLSTYVRTKPAQGKKVDFNSNAVKSYRAQLSALRNDFKQWLRANAPKAKVTGEFDVSLNAVAVKLNGEALATIAAAPQALRAQYQGLYYPSATDPDVALISAPQAWAQGGGPATAGAGIKIAIVDSGIDATHPCFDDAGYAAQQQLGDTRFTNNKVIAAKVFNNKTPSQHYTPEAIDSHGTHVSGTAACNYLTPAPVNGVTTYDMSGVAPRALLGNYNVFPALVESARSEDILNALDAAYSDGFDIANMSLGGGSHGIQDLLMVAVDNLDQANMVVAVAAGNSGPGLFTVQSPGAAQRALTAGGATVGHYIGAPVTVEGTTYGAAVGDFATVSSDLTAPLGVVAGSIGGLGDACTALPTNSLAGQIALVSRGNCFFSVKIRNAQAAGAVATLVANNVFGDPFAMGTDGLPSQPTIPAYMVSQDDGQTLKTKGGAATTIGVALAYFQTGNDDIMYSNSGQGPTDVDFRVKPDVVAPGVNVLSSIPVSYCGGDPCFAFFTGTSMATPHLAGSAAIVRQQHPEWSAADVRSAVVNTADSDVLLNFQTGAPQNNVNINGTGRENLLSAVNALIGLDPVSVSFGAVPSGSGQTRQATVTLTNLTDSPKTYSLAIGGQPASSVVFGVSPASVTIAAGGQTSVTVTMSAVPGAALGPKQAFLEVSTGGSEIAHAALFTWVK